MSALQNYYYFFFGSLVQKEIRFINTQGRNATATFQFVTIYYALLLVIKIYRIILFETRFRCEHNDGNCINYSLTIIYCLLNVEFYKNESLLFSLFYFTLS